MEFLIILLVTVEIHRYEGIAFPKSFGGGFIKAVKRAITSDSLSDQVRREVLLSGKEFLPSPETVMSAILHPESSKNDTAEAYLEQIQSVMNSLKYQMLDEKLCKLDPELPKKVRRYQSLG